jgi:hypothetical protein
MEMIYCDFRPNQNGTACFYFILTDCLILLNYRQTKMDWICRRQIRARTFLRPAER